MISDLARELIRQIDANDYKNDHGEPYQVIVGLDSGIVYRGVVISPETWLMINTTAGSGLKTVNNERLTVPGSWHTNTTLDLGADRFDYLFMTEVEFLSGGVWISGCSLCTNVKYVQTMGDQYLRSR